MPEGPRPYHGAMQATRVRSVVTNVVSPVQDFIRTESSSGIVLIGAALAAFIWANSPWAAGYFELLDAEAGLRFGEWSLEKTLHLWVNDLLMAIFFFLVGLEIKRELLVGELKSRRRAALPIAGALGGMVVPALIFFAFNAGTPAVRGWGIPMATDIAFALGVLALLGTRVRLSLKIFLLALAIVDDLGAVLVIAVFYTETLDIGSLLLAFAILGGAFAYGRFGSARPLAYVVIGAVMWYFMFKSGVHATVAGVLLALTVPLRHKMTSDQLRAQIQPVIDRDDFAETEGPIEHLQGILHRAHSPLQDLEHMLSPYVAFLIMPVFAFFNAGVAIFGGGDVAIVSSVSIGVFLGLILGKPLGILLFVWLAVRFGITDLPHSATWSGMIGVGILAGIGFTMSLFISNLAFGQSAQLDEAKIGVLAASVVAAVVGLAFLSRNLPSPLTRQGQASGDPVEELAG